MIKTILIDPQKLFRVSLKSFISSFSFLEVECDVSSIIEIPKDVNRSADYLIILDPKLSSRIDINTIQKSFPFAKILILTDQLSSNHLTEYLKFGIQGLFSKNDCPLQLRKGIHQIVEDRNANEVVIGPVSRQILLDDIGNRNKRNVSFSDREMQILQLVCLEKTNSEISGLLGLSIRTIESHRRRMIEKADCRSIIGVIVSVLEGQAINVNGIVNNSNQAS